MSSDPNADYALRPSGSAAPMSPAASGDTTKSDVREEGKQLASKAVDTVRAEADKRKDAVTTQVQAVSSALGSAADEIERQDDLPSWLVSGVRKVATSVDQFAGTLDSKSSKNLLNDLKAFASDKPAIFLAACAAAGFVASRVLSADNGQGGGQ